MSRAELEEEQLRKLQRLVGSVLDSNAFYQDKLAAAGVAGVPADLESFRNYPCTRKSELVADREVHPPYGSNLTYPFESYSRYCQTSGTSGEPLPWLDTETSWSAMLDCWESIFRAAGVEEEYDRVLFAFSFGPFLGFWTAYEAATRMGCLAIPGGGMSGSARLSCMETNAATVLCCTPTYALRLGGEIGDGYPDLDVRKIIVAGEPGGSIPETRERIRELWRGADVYDHHGMTEVGPVSFPVHADEQTLGVLETFYFAEIVNVETGEEVAEGEVGELVLTTLERDGCPLLRYRTGDLVKKVYFDDPDSGSTLGLGGGILGRVDDMVIVRGVNIFPSALENVVRRFDAVEEFRVAVRTVNEMAELEVTIETAGGEEDPSGVRDALHTALSDTFGLRIPVELAEAGSLPRPEFKAKRWIKLGGVS